MFLVPAQVDPVARVGSGVCVESPTFYLASASAGVSLWDHCHLVRSSVTGQPRTPTSGQCPLAQRQEVGLNQASL